LLVPANPGKVAALCTPSTPQVPAKSPRHRGWACIE